MNTSSTFELQQYLRHSLSIVDFYSEDHEQTIVVSVNSVTENIVASRAVYQMQDRICFARNGPMSFSLIITFVASHNASGRVISGSRVDNQATSPTIYHTISRYSAFSGHSVCNCIKASQPSFESPRFSFVPPPKTRDVAALPTFFFRHLART